MILRSASYDQNECALTLVQEGPQDQDDMSFLPLMVGQSVRVVAARTTPVVGRTVQLELTFNHEGDAANIVRKLNSANHKDRKLALDVLTLMLTARHMKVYKAAVLKKGEEA